MAINYKPITQLLPLSGIDAGDLIPIVDINDLSQSPVGTTKKITFNQLGSNVSVDQITSPTDAVILTVNTVYFANSTGLITFILPASSNHTDWIEIVGVNTGLWKINQRVGQQIIFDTSATTVGNAGSMSSTYRYGSIKMRCILDNLTWSVVSSNAPVINFTFV